jgi:hypothetical protein
LQGDDDPVRWAREARLRDQEALDLDGDGYGPGAEYFDGDQGGGGGGFGVTGLDEGTETLLLVGLCLFVACVPSDDRCVLRLADDAQVDRLRSQRAPAGGRSAETGAAATGSGSGRATCRRVAVHRASISATRSAK